MSSASPAIESTITRFNSYYLSAPNRTNLYYLTQIYGELKTKYWNLIEPSRQQALTIKLLAFQARIRAAEAGQPVAPIPAPTDKVIPIKAPSISLPTEIPVSTQQPAAAAAASTGATPADVLKNIGDQIMAFYDQNKSAVQMAALALLALKVLPMILPPAQEPSRRKR